MRLQAQQWQLQEGCQLQLPETQPSPRPAVSTCGTRSLKMGGSPSPELCKYGTKDRLESCRKVDDSMNSAEENKTKLDNNA